MNRGRKEKEKYEHASASTSSSKRSVELIAEIDEVQIR